ncbi:MAG: TonB-dependent receptor plug domain-containing protein [Gemmatimonadaceae bacterium]|nr:TonB-dependent receptor plug domain-containing protein [Gemmatimonadaceae bacterium]
MHGTYTFSVDAPTPKRCDACDGELSLDARLASAFSISREWWYRTVWLLFDGPRTDERVVSSLAVECPPSPEADSELERRRAGLPPILCTQHRASAAFSTIRESTHHHLLPMPTFVKLQRSRLHRRVIALLGLASALAASPLAAQETGGVATARGQVVTPAGVPVPRATIELLPAAGRAGRTVRTDDNGRFMLTTPAAGRARLRATSIGYVPSSVEVDLVIGREVTANITLVAMPSVLNQVVVSASRSGQELAKVPASVSVVSADVIQGTGRRNTSVEEALRNVPGVVVRDQLGGASRATIAIRGAGSSNTFGIRGIRLLIDGVPKNNAGGSGQDLANLDMSSIASIEVLRGPASTLYGNQAGGVVSMTSEAGGETRRQGRSSAGASASPACTPRPPATHSVEPWDTCSARGARSRTVIATTPTLTRRGSRPNSSSSRTQRARSPQSCRTTISGRTCLVA